jgi:DNA-formamidopyrimidine glycosylase
VPEGHTVHRHARVHAERFAAAELHVTSPQGRFADGAALLDGTRLTSTEAHGKHLWLAFAGERWLHVHLGLYGTWTFGDGEPAAPVGAVRVRLEGAGSWADLRGPTACEIVTAVQVASVRARLGPDPLRRDADPSAAWERIRRSRTPIGALLMDQAVVAGVGNVYRAEVLFRAGIDPHRPGRQVTLEEWQALWTDLRTLMRAGVRAGRIITTRPADRPRRSGPVTREDSFYVYRRTGEPCRLCGTPVVTEPFVGRNLYRCVVCQPA